ncbi:MAG: hypothetical protein CSA96_01545 [Bacteroidetes bacterium]|nr:MAG: hypothetical protein CSA96_01545 [Bacteroidota bacterium]
MHKLSGFICAGLLASMPLLSQRTLSLEETLVLAREHSIQAMLNKNEFLEAYWNYKMHRAKMLPNLYLGMTPVSYDKSFYQIYNFVDEKDEFREMYKLKSTAGLALDQNIGITGGRVSLSSGLQRIQNLRSATDSSGISGDTYYSSVPFMVSYHQPLFAHNPYKWERILEPKKYEQARKELMQDLQDLNVEAVQMYFAVLKAQNHVLMAEAEVAATDTLLRIGQTRQEIADINREDLLNLELNHNNARVKLLQYKEEQRKAEDRFRLFTGLSKGEAFALLPPGNPPFIVLSPDDALILAHLYNPDIFMLEIDRLEAQKNSDKAVKEYRFNMDMVFRYGINQSAEDFSGAYKDPLDRQIAEVSLQMPILDWGRKKRAVALAKSRQEIVEARSSMELQTIEQEITNLAYQYALKDLETRSSARADSIAGLSYLLALERFRSGEAGILDLDNAQNKKVAARQQLLDTRERFWTLFYQLQSSTLYDLRLKKELEMDVEQYVE